MVKKQNLEVPLSENTHKRNKVSREECISELRAIALENPDMVISRNYFRVHSSISESGWTVHFGTFHQFKADAGITPNRHSRKMEKCVALHSSREKAKELTLESKNFEGKYLKPTGKRYQTIMTISDIHDTANDPFTIDVFIDSVKRIKPECIVLLGDILDLPDFSKYQIDIRTYNVIGRIKWVHHFLERIREASPDSQIDFVEGNHEARLLIHLANSSPAMLTVLSDLHKFTISSLLGLDKYEINWVGRVDLAVFNESELQAEVKKNYLVKHNCLLFHHFPEGRNLGMAGACGHNHKLVVWSGYNPIQGPTVFYQMGASCKRVASYCDGSKWNNGFLIIHCDTQSQRSQMVYIDTTFGHCEVGGKFYIRPKAQF